MKFCNSIWIWGWISKNHLGISFYEEAWMKAYINKNTKLRTKAADTENEFEKDF